MLVYPLEPIIITNKKLATTVSTGVIQAPQALKTPAIQEFIAAITPLKMGAKRTPQRFIRNGVDGSTSDYSSSGTSDIDSCTNPNLPFVCIWNVSVGNMRKNTTLKFMETSELHASIDRRFSNYSNAPFVGIQILCDELSVSSGRDLY